MFRRTHGDPLVKYKCTVDMSSVNEMLQPRPRLEQDRSVQSHAKG